MSDMHFLLMGIYIVMPKMRKEFYDSLLLYKYCDGKRKMLKMSTLTVNLLLLLIVFYHDLFSDATCRCC